MPVASGLARKPSVTVGRRATVDERFFVKVQTVEGSDCWTWIGALSEKGYALFKVAGRGSARAARWAYEQFREPIEDGLELDHLCRNKACVNPDHLEAVTQAENIRRQWAAWQARHSA